MKTAAFSRNVNLRRAFAALALFSGLLAGHAQAQNLQQIQVMDRQVGLPALSIAIPQGWTHQFQSVWDKNSDPMVSVSFEAAEPRGAGKFYMSPTQVFYDFPELNGRTPMHMKPMAPRQAFEFMLNRASQMDPSFKAKRYRIVQSQDFPPTNANGSQNVHSLIHAEFVENGVQKQEIVDVHVTVTPNPTATMWTLFWYGLQDKKTVPLEVIANRCAAIAKSVQFLPQWQQRQMAFTQQGNAEGIARSNAIRAQGDARTRALSAQGDAQRAAIQQRAQRQMQSSDRVTNMTVDAIKNENVYRDSSGGTFRDTDKYKYIYTNPTNGQRIYTDDSTYNPNADKRVNDVQWQQAPIVK